MKEIEFKLTQENKKLVCVLKGKHDWLVFLRPDRNHPWRECQVCGKNEPHRTDFIRTPR